MDHSLPGSSVHGILQARILKWVAMPSSRGSSWPRDQIHVSLIKWHPVCRSSVYTTCILKIISGLFIITMTWKQPSVQFSSVQSLSSVRLFATPWITALQVSLSITNSQSSLRLASIESVMPSSSHLILCHPLLLLAPIPPSIRVFSNESALRLRWPKYWSFSFNIIPSKEHLGLICFGMDWLDLLSVQGTLKSLLQHHSSNISILRCSAFFIVQITSVHDHWNNHRLE